MVPWREGGGRKRSRIGGRMRSCGLRGAAIALPIVLVLCFAGAVSAASSGRVRVGSSAPVPPGTQTVGRTAASTELHLTVALNPQPGVTAYATGVSTPGSPLYGHFLSVWQFARRFGATPIAVAAVISTLRAEGLSVGEVSANQLMIPVAGTAGEISKAFSISFAQVRLPSGRIAYANEQAPALPSTIASYVQGVVGLSDVARDEPTSLRRPNPALRLGVARGRRLRPRVATGGPQPCSSAVAGQAYGGLTADEVASAYQFSGLYGAGARGAGQTIALYELEPYNPSDIAAYQSCYHTAVPISNANVDGGPGAPTPDGEAALDIEQAIGLAPSASVLVYQGPNTSASVVDVLSAIVSQDHAKVISSSWGLCESLTDSAVRGAESNLLAEAALQGQSYFTSSGDSGSAACFQSGQGDTSLSVGDPASQPFATGVGGTTVFTRGPNCPTLNCYWAPGNPLLQSVWNDGLDTSTNTASATGGGISQAFAMPSYQSGASRLLGVINANSSGQPCGVAGYCREVPDVAADGDPQTGYVVFVNGAWGIIGGTSAAAPLWASFMALTNSQSACRGLSIGFANPALYAVASSNYAAYFSDVTLSSIFTGAANNDAISANNGLFPVLGGYDMTTGLGSMLGPRLAGILCALRVPPPPATTVRFTKWQIVVVNGRRNVTTNVAPGKTVRYCASTKLRYVFAYFAISGPGNVSVSEVWRLNGRIIGRFSDPSLARRLPGFGITNIAGLPSGTWSLTITASGKTIGTSTVTILKNSSC